MSTNWPILAIALIAGLIIGGLASPVWGDPLPQPKVGQCPAGYTQSGGFCAPMSGTRQNAVPKVGQCPSGYTQSGAYCLEVKGR